LVAAYIPAWLWSASEATTPSLANTLDRLAGSIKAAADAAEAARNQSENAQHTAAQAATVAETALHEATTSRAALDDVDNRLNVLMLRVDRPLSNAEWKNIQSHLAAKGFQVRVDGVKGSETCAAIRLYQRQLGSGETGMLTPEQIPTMLDNAATQTGVRLVDDRMCGLPAGFHKHRQLR
jgi:hypothetical protein